MRRLLLALFLLPSLAFAKSKKPSLIGMDITTVVENAGYPDGVLYAPNGNPVYVWGESHTVQGADFHYRTRSGNLGYTVPGQLLTYWCRVYIEVEAGVVVNVETRGNNCP